MFHSNCQCYFAENNISKPTTKVPKDRKDKTRFLHFNVAYLFPIYVSWFPILLYDVFILSGTFTLKRVILISEMWINKLLLLLLLLAGCHLWVEFVIGPRLSSRVKLLGSPVLLPSQKQTLQIPIQPGWETHLKTSWDWCGFTSKQSTF